MKAIVVKVLILISVEDTFRDLKLYVFLTLKTCLNPYFSGRYVPSGVLLPDRLRADVLILISVEDTFRGRHSGIM